MSVLKGKHSTSKLTLLNMIGLLNCPTLDVIRRYTYYEKN